MKREEKANMVNLMNTFFYSFVAMCLKTKNGGLSYHKGCNY